MHSETLTVGVSAVDDGVFVLDVLDDTADQTLRPLRSGVHCHQLERSQRLAVRHVDNTLLEIGKDMYVRKER